MSGKSGYSQLFAGFQHIFTHFMHIRRSMLAENSPKIEKYVYFLARFLQKNLHILECQNQYQSNVKGLKILVAKKHLNNC